MDKKQLEVFLKQTAKDYDVDVELVRRAYRHVGLDGLYDELESELRAGRQ